MEGIHTRLEVDTVFPNCLQVESFVVYMSRVITSSAPTNAYPGFPHYHHGNKGSFVRPLQAGSRSGRFHLYYRVLLDGPHPNYNYTLAS